MYHSLHLDKLEFHILSSTRVFYKGNIVNFFILEMVAAQTENSIFPIFKISSFYNPKNFQTRKESNLNIYMD